MTLRPRTVRVPVSVPKRGNFHREKVSVNFIHKKNILMRRKFTQGKVVSKFLYTKKFTCIIMTIIAM